MTCFFPPLPGQTGQTGQAQTEDAASQLEREIIETLREETGLHEPIAAPIAAAIVRGLRRKRGGAEIYVPTPCTRERDERIRREFTGAASIARIRAWSGLSRSAIYRIARATPKNPAAPLETGQSRR